MNTNSRLQYAFRGILATIIWILWKRRNKIKHGGKVQFEGLIQQVISLYNMLITAKYTKINIQGRNWMEMSRNLGDFKPKIYHFLVNWKPCNTDGASKGNFGESAYGICFKNWERNLVNDQAEQMRIATNIKAGTRAIKMALKIK